MLAGGARVESTCVCPRGQEREAERESARRQASLRAALLAAYARAWDEQRARAGGGA